VLDPLAVVLLVVMFVAAKVKLLWLIITTKKTIKVAAKNR
jgi:hypothetical protein